MHRTVKSPISASDLRQGHFERAAWCFLLSLVAVPCLVGAENPVDPLFLHRSLAEAAEKAMDISTKTAHYKPLFGAGDSNQTIVKSLARYGELTVEPGGASGIVGYSNEEQLYYVLDGSGVLHYADQTASLKKNDFVYLPVGVQHGISNPTQSVCRVMIMGFKIPSDMKIAPTPKLVKSNLEDVSITAAHGPGTKFKHLLGDTCGRKDILATANVLGCAFVMEFDPGINNYPHHHDTLEEVYFVLRGQGEIATGGGPTGQEGRYPVKEGDAYFFRLNATVRFYRGPGKENPLILAVQSYYPFRRTGLAAIK